MTFTNDSIKNTERTHAATDGEQKSNEMIQAARDNVQKAQNLRVDVNRIDKVMDVAGEVVLVRNRLLNISNYFDIKYTADQMTEILMEAVSFLDRITSDMQIAVMKMRMQPIQKILSKFPRLVRDISASVKKDVELQIFGEGTEVDKTVIEHIGDPMTHILRNSIDHAINRQKKELPKASRQKERLLLIHIKEALRLLLK